MALTIALIIGGILGLYAIGVTLLYLFQRRLMYKPSPYLEDPTYYGFSNVQSITLLTRDHVCLKAWYRPAPDNTSPIFVYCHGNAGHLGDRAQKLGAILSQYGLLAVSYRGYGESGGVPSEQGFYHDVRAAIMFLEKQGISEKRIVLYGESLGTGIAIHIATEYPIAALILEAPYTSMVDLARMRYPYIPVHYLVRDRYHSFDKIRDIRAPLLILHGEQDDTVPVAHGRALFEKANHPKEAIFFPSAGHTDIEVAAIIEALKNFLQKHANHLT